MRLLLKDGLPLTWRSFWFFCCSLQQRSPLLPALPGLQVVLAGNQATAVYLTVVSNGLLTAIGVDLASLDQPGMVDGTATPLDLMLEAEVTVSGIESLQTTGGHKMDIVQTQGIMISSLDHILSIPEDPQIPL
ncbi:unnamed protein product [Spodoptera exigua]|nr:unnamed protein product [Spodoptera exigua]